jgi:uncharacterized phage protein gp47/JayE
MAVYFKKTRDQILQEALAKIKDSTLISATNPGSVTRAITEAITTELGAFYDILDANISQSLISTASGRALDSLGSIYDIKRKTLSDIAKAEQKIGSFYFYVENTHESPIIIPSGTKVFTSSVGYVGRQLAFSTDYEVTIPAGSLRAYVSITPLFSDNIFTAPKGTLIANDYISPTNTLVKCTNPKEIAASDAYETDADYRARIIKGIRVASSGTIEAVRFAGLNVEGVRDIKIRQSPYGLGSFEVMVVSEQENIAATVTRQVRTVIENVRPVGVTMFVRSPVLRPLDMSVSVMSNAVNSPEYTNLRDRIRIAITRYLNTLMPGDTIVYNKMIQEMMDSSGIIKDIQVLRYAPNGVDSIRRNYTPKEYEQVVPGNIQVSIS